MAVNFHRVQRTYSLLLNIMTFCCSSTCVVWRYRKYYCLEDTRLYCSFTHRRHEHPFYRTYESLSTFCWYKTQKWNYRNFLILSFFGRYLYRRRKTNTWLWTEQYFRGQEWADSHCWICCFMVSLTDQQLLDTAYCSLSGSPLWGCPFIQRGTNAQCSQRAARDEMKGRKTHAQTIHAMDTATVGSCADCNVFCVVTCADQSRCWACNNSVSYHDATRPWFRLFLASLIKEHV